MNIHTDNLTATEIDQRASYCNYMNNRSHFLSRPSVMLGLVPIKDGNQWCVLYGEDLQVGIAGFGNSPQKAMEDFDKDWVKDIPDMGGAP